MAMVARNSSVRQIFYSKCNECTQTGKESSGTEVLEDGKMGVEQRQVALRRSGALLPLSTP